MGYGVGVGRDEGLYIFGEGLGTLGESDEMGWSIAEHASKWNHVGDGLGWITNHFMSFWLSHTGDTAHTLPSSGRERVEKVNFSSLPNMERPRPRGLAI